ncbi:Auxilliary activities family 12 protein [Periconia macrospinosa]|uniref:Auxilliary activities family 12 protein n=1 Tax=Periconia macrospinosa TaxID=97972 RepID=A0A2V1E8U3_9PLEO|nr:Auxilliary activities family 12 protein [Periconia macrospinosa]
MISMQFLAVALTTFVSSTVAQSCEAIPPSFEPTWGSGFSGRVLLNGLSKPRGIIFDSANNLLIVEQSSGGVRHVTLTDNGGDDLCVASSKKLIDAQGLNHGIEISADGTTLFVSSKQNVYAYPYNSTAGTVGERKTLVTGMSNGTHSTRTLRISKTNPDALIVSVGSDGNLDAGASEEGSGRSQLRVFSIAETSQASIDYTQGEILGWGLRNTVGVTENPATGDIWSVENGVDNMEKDGVDIHADNPCEELNFHGQVDGSTPQFGTNYGYPECFAAWDPSIIPNNTGIEVGTQFAFGTGNDTECLERTPPKLCFPAHTAPLGVAFNDEGTAAYIAFHGSWNREDPDGYRLSKIEFDPATGQPIEPSTSTTAAINVLSNPDNTACPQGCVRPVDVLFDTQGRLFMTSDATNELWVISGSL